MGWKTYAIKIYNKHDVRCDGENNNTCYKSSTHIIKECTVNQISGKGMIKNTFQVKMKTE